MALDSMTADFTVRGAPVPDYLGMSDTDLFQALTLGDVSRDWWNLPGRNYRKALSLRIVTTWLVPFQNIPYRYRGTTKPWWDPRTDPQPGQSMSGLESHSSIFYGILGDRTKVPADLWFYSAGQHEWYPFRPEYPSFYLPIASAIGYEWMITMQLGQDISVFDNWHFFMSGEADIAPGHGWMPTYKSVTISEIIGIRDTLAGYGIIWVAYPPLYEWKPGEF